MCPACLLRGVLEEDAMAWDVTLTTELDVGSTLGPFRIVRLLGRGGMASVYEAHERRLDRRVALKVLPPAFLHDQSFAHRFEREARLVAGLEHPNIVPIYASGIDEGVPWISMRLLSGGTLSDLLCDGPLPASRVAQILRGIAQGLDYAHGCGVIHRDIKPTNIVLDDRGSGCLVDFGVARLLERDVATTTAGTVVGTPQYMAPEQALGLTIDSRCDVYCLGTVAYEMLTGTPPFTASSAAAILTKQVNAPFPVPPREQVSSAIARVLEKALAKEPRARWPTASAFVDALETSIHKAQDWKPIGFRTAIAGTVSAAAVIAFLTTRQPTERQQPSPVTSQGESATPSAPGPDRTLAEERDTAAGNTTAETTVPTLSASRTSSRSRPANRAGATTVEPGAIEAQLQSRDPSSDHANVSPSIPTSPETAPPSPRSAGIGLDAPTPVAPTREPAQPVDVVTDALITHRVDPIYPSLAKAAEIQGEVLVMAECATDGRVTKVTVLRSAHHVLDDAATKAVLQYRCQPGLRNGIAEASTLRIPVVFKLK